MAATTALYLLPAAVVHDLWSGKLLAWAAVGVLVHIFGFVHNEVRDRDHDAGRAYLQHKPLVEKPAMREGAIGLALIALVVAFVLGLQLLDGWLFLLFLAALVAAVAYNETSKRSALAPVYLAGWGALSVLAVGLSGPWSEAAAPLWVLTVYVLLSILYQVHLGYLKDPGEVPIGGVRTVLYTIGFLMAVIAFSGALWMGGLFFLVVLFAATGTVVIHSWGLLRGVRDRRYGYLSWHRPTALRVMGAHEFAGYVTAVTLVLPALVAVEAMALLVVPVAWYVVCNRLLYGRAMAPGV